MQRYKYRAVNPSGRPVRGLISASSEADLYNQLQQAGLELVGCTALGAETSKSNFLGGIGRPKVALRDLIQIFVQLEQLQSAGVPLLDALQDIRDTADNPTMRDIMSEIHRDVTDGTSLSEAMNRHPKVFSNLYTSLVHAGEETGDLTSVYKQLVRYLSWVDAMQSKIKKATLQPKIAAGAVGIMLVVMLGHVVPQIAHFIENLDQKLPPYTVLLIATSNFFQKYWMYIVAAPFVIMIFIKVMKKLSSRFYYYYDLMVLNMPVIGKLIRKSSIARYAQTFGSLYASGIDVLSALRSAKQTVSNVALVEGLEAVEEYVQSGSSISESFDASGQFPSLVVRMLRVGENSGNLTPVLDKVSEFYTKDVDEAVEEMIGMIQPALTGLMGGMILWIAVSVFGPIYSSFENIDF
jgi:type IV pilus assembly protein PilC